MLTTQSKLEFDFFIGKRIVFLRKQRRLTQKDLALQIGISFQQLQKYEYGANRLSAARLFQLAKVFETSVFSLFKDVISKFGDSSQMTAEMNFDLTSEQIHFLDAFNKISKPELRYKLFELISVFSKAC